jgi:hypothetical protein
MAWVDCQLVGSTLSCDPFERLAGFARTGAPENAEQDEKTDQAQRDQLRVAEHQIAVA